MLTIVFLQLKYNDQVHKGNPGAILLTKLHTLCKFHQWYYQKHLQKGGVFSPRLMWILARGIRVLWLRRDKFTWTTKSYGGKGTAFSQEESAPTLALTGFYCFSGHIILRIVLIYYAQVHFGWLQKTKEKILLLTSKRKDICKCKGKSGWTGYTSPWKV